MNAFEKKRTLPLLENVRRDHTLGLNVHSQCGKNRSKLQWETFDGIVPKNSK